MTRAHHAQQVGAVTRRQVPTVHRPGAPCFLPTWLVSDLNARGGFTLNSSMQCLQVSLVCYDSYHAITLINHVCQVGSYVYNSLHDHLVCDSEDKAKDKKKLAMARISNFPCPANLDKKPSIVHVHPSNGVFVAVDGDTIYCSCTECSFQEDRENKGGSLPLLKGTEGQKYAWAIINNDVYHSLVISNRIAGKKPSLVF